MECRGVIAAYDPRTASVTVWSSTAVIDAADVVALDPAEMHLRAAMRAAIGNHLRPAGVAAVQGEILAHHADRFGVAPRQILGAHDRHLKAPHKRAHRRARAGPGKIVSRARFAFDDIHGASPQITPAL